MEIDIDIRGLDSDHQGVSCLLIVSFESGACFPPAQRGIDGDAASACKFRGGPPPDISMQRASVTLVCSYEPRGIRISSTCSFFLVSRRQVDALAKCISRFEWPLDVEAEAVGLVPVT